MFRDFTLKLDKSIKKTLPLVNHVDKVDNIKEHRVAINSDKSAVAVIVKLNIESHFLERLCAFLASSRDEDGI